jgi:RHS repeat-associated protein
MSENGVVTWLLQDQVSSTTVTVNTDSSSASEVKYSAFGEIRASTGTTVTDKKYTGQQQESEIGLDFYVSRFYDPTTAHFVQPDSSIPESGSSKSFDRYAYVNWNPINFSDPSGNIPQWLSGFGEFFLGFSTEFTRANNWIGAIIEPQVAESLSPSESESSAMIAGRIIGDIATIAIGVTEIAGGGTITGGGAVVGCGVTLCLASAPAIAVGIAAISTGVITTASGSAALGENIGIAFSKRHENDLHPDPNATGPHSVVKRDPETGRVTNYETYRPQTNPRNPNPWEKVLRYDNKGKPHPDTITKQYILPHIHDFINNLVRRPFWFEKPK